LLPEGIEALLLDHARSSFHEDERRLQLVGERREQVRKDAEEAKSKVRHVAGSRLEKLQGCLDRVNAANDAVTAEIRTREEECQNLRSLIERGNGEQWSETEQAAAQSAADAALSDLAQSISQGERQVEALRERNDLIIQDGRSSAEQKNAQDELLSLLAAGSCPGSYQDALSKETTRLNSEFQTEFDSKTQALVDQRKECSITEAELIRLKMELESARTRASQMASAGSVERLVRRLDPRNLVRRREDAVQSDIDAKQGRLLTARAAVVRIEEELVDLRRLHEEKLVALPDVVRQTLIEKTTKELSDISGHLADIEQISEDIRAELVRLRSVISTQRADFEYEHRQFLSVYFDEAIRNAQLALREGEEDIRAASIRLQRIEQNQTRLSRLIEGQCTRLQSALLDCEEQEKRQIGRLEQESARLHRRLSDRAPRAGMLQDLSTGTFREQDGGRHATQSIRATYRRQGDVPPSLATLPILLQRRTQTGYESKDDQRLAAVIASICGHDEPAEDERPAFIDQFCDVVLGDDQEERPFFISIISKQGERLLVMIRPAQVLPQLKGGLPEAMSVCVLCRFEYGARRTSDNTTLLVLDAALVPDCEPRPFERTVSFVRHSSRDSLPPVASPLDELLDQTNAPPPILLDELQDRLSDWQGYLDWANGEILRNAPWAILGPGEWVNDTWKGVILCEDKQAARSISGDGKPGNAGQSLEVYPLSDAWQRRGREGSANVYRCSDFKVNDPAAPQPDTAHDCPWPRPFSCRVSMKFSHRDASALANLPEDIPLGLRDMTEAVGSRAQLERYKDSLKQLQFGANEKQQGNRLSAAPYLVASLFNVTQAAKSSEKPGRLLNAEIARLYRLNEDQGAAVEVMLAAPEIAYIQGPPGTGKTTMIAAACAHFVRLGQRVLIASQTNLAVENALDRLKGDPEVRQLWLSKNEGEQRKSAAISEWYQMAVEHVEETVCRPVRTLTSDVTRMQTWLERARRLERVRSEAARDIHKREDALRLIETQLDELRARQKAKSEADARAVWWAMARSALAELTDWDPSCFAPELAPDVADLLKLLAKHDGGDPRLDVSPRALHGQTQDRVRDIQSRLRAKGDEAGRKRTENVRKRILDAWPDDNSSGPEGSNEEELLSRALAQAESDLHRARQAFEDASSRGDTADEQSLSLLSEASSFSDLLNDTSDLAAAIAEIEDLTDLHASRLEDASPLEDWLPLLDQWVVDLKQQAENPSATDRMGERYVRNANVIGITCNANFRILSDSDFSRFDVVIVDEVSKATPLELLRPMLLAPRAILVGDHRQLPPTFEFASFSASNMSPTEDEDPDALEREAELLRKYERLTTASLFRDGFAEIDPGSRAALHTQYRMHPQIMSLINRFYDGRLESGLVDPDGLDDSANWSWRTHGLSLNSRTGGQYLTKNLHALWIDSSDDESGKPAYEDSDGTGIGNKLEAQLVAQIVEDIVDACEREHRKKTIAVATFYNRQKRLIRNALQDRLGGRLRDLQIDVETVDRFQGKEADIVIVSMVRNRSQRLGRNSNPAKFERINVAFSRARDLLVVIGARKTFERFEVSIEPVDGGTPRRICVYGQIMDDIRELGGLWQAKDILGPGSPRSKGHSA